MSLLDRHTGFVRALRHGGLPVSLAEGLDAARALTVLDLADRETLRAAYAASLVKRHTHRPVFDTLFELWFPLGVTAGTGVGDADAEGDADAAESADASAAADASDASDAEVFRDRLRELLLGDDDIALRALAREAVGRFGEVEGPSGGSWSAHLVGRALDPRTLMAGLLRAVLGGQLPGGVAERNARRMIQTRVDRLDQHILSDVRRRLAEERGVERVAETAVKPAVENLDILRANRADLVALRREIQPLAQRLATRLTIRQRAGRNGRLDFRRTVRASLSTGGVPLATHHRPRRPHKPELVVLCDASESVASFAHFTLMLAYALREQFARVRAFAFIDTVDEVTRFFERPGGDITEAMRRLTAEANLVRISGHSDYGHSFKVFVERYGDVIGPKSSLLILGDARNNYQDPALAALAAMVTPARHAWWLNPEPERDWDTGDSIAGVYARHISMIECRNLTQLGQFVGELA
ncbi:vWA domain-containing protein [Embleya sp. NBC_00896]|uniref:vWA domain-containing protein n=1 Tax=Embleya sp. NBC_00896 TaxID=2975961 RepID=UPI00386E3392|nr:VWA domain-containing protein [Embleya sp. NBC_00896]